MVKQTTFAKQAELLKILSHPKRIEILSLMRSQPLTVGQIAKMSGLRQPTVSQHLMQLRQLGIVSAKKQGKEMYYVVADHAYIKILDTARAVLGLSAPSLSKPVVVDPVCHMHLTVSSASYTHEYNGVKHYFCGKGCLQSFRREHERQL